MLFAQFANYLYLRNKINIIMRNYNFITSLFLLIGISANANCPINVVGKDAMAMGVYIEEIETGNILVDYQSKRVYTPASVTKAFTTATALTTLSEDFKFNTPVYISGEIVNNTLYGDIIVYGVGDPTIESSHFPKNKGFCDSIIAKIDQLGIKKIEGKCRVSSKDFNSDCAVNPNWELEDIAWDYGTGLHAFNYKDNTFNLQVSNTINTSPKVNDITVTELPTIGSDGIDLMRPFNSNEIFIVGDISKKYGYSNTCSMPFPQDVFVDELTQKLLKRDIILDNAEIDNANKLTKTLIYTHQSPKLIEILQSLMVRSDNLFAESMLRAVAKGKSLKAAINTELSLWKKRGLNTSLITIRDGSGLARTNRLSPIYMASLLKWMYYSKYFDAYLSCFPRSGVNGTLKSFLKGTRLEGKLAMKTGSMNGVQCYAGYKLDNNSKPTHIVVIMVNHFFCDRSTLRDAIGKMLLKTF